MQCYCALARQVARRLTRMYEAELASVGMNPTQFELLSNLQGRPGMNQVELARRVDVDQTTLSRNLKLLIAKGWVVATETSADRRRVEYRLSEGGEAAVKVAMLPWQQATEKTRTRLGSEAETVWKTLECLGSVAVE